MPDKSVPGDQIAERADTALDHGDTPPATRRCSLSRSRSLGLALGLLSLWAPASQAQTHPSSTVHTNLLGPLELVNGYPTAATACKLYDALDLQRATQAYLMALPAVGFKALYDAQAKTMGVRNGDVLLYRTLKDKAGMLTPNITTLYAFSFWDLAKQGPLVVEVPEGLTAGGVLDIWQQPITDMGQTGPDKGAGGRYLILPPGGPEVVAPGYRIFRSPSNQIWFGTRGLAPDKAVAEATVRQHRLYGWNQRSNPPMSRYEEVGGRPWQSAQPADLSYWRLLSDLYANEPVAPRDRMMFGMLAPLGISPGQPFNPDARQARILTEAAQLGDLMARTIAYDKRTPGATVYPGKHWVYSGAFRSRSGIARQTARAVRRTQLLVLRGDRHVGGHAGPGAGLRPGVPGGLQGQPRPVAGRRPQLPHAGAGRRPGEAVLVDHPLRQPEPGSADHPPGRRRSQLPQARSGDES
jgi:hypothetical protein